MIQSIFFAELVQTKLTMIQDHLKTIEEQVQSNSSKCNEFFLLLILLCYGILLIISQITDTLYFMRDVYIHESMYFLPIKMTYNPYMYIKPIYLIINLKNLYEHI